MPIQGLLTGGGQSQAGGLFAGLGDKIRAREDYDKKKTQIIKTAMKQGKSWQDIAQQTGLDLEEIQSISQSINPKYGVQRERNLASKAWDTANILDNGRSWTTADPSKDQAKKGVITQVGEGVGSSYKRVGQATGEAINQFVGGAEQQANFVSGQDVLQSVIDRATKELKSSNLDPAKRAKIERLRAETIKSRDKLYGERSSDLSKTIEATDPYKGAAAIGSIGFDIATLGTGAGAATAGKQTAKQVAKEVVSGALQGGVSGALGAVEQRGKDVNLKDIERGAAIGGAAGGALVAGGALLGEAGSKVKGKLNERQAADSAKREVSHLTTETNLPGIIKSGKLKASQAPLDGFEGKKGVFLQRGDNPFGMPGEDNVRIVYDSKKLGRNISEQSDGQIVVGGDLSNKRIKRIEVANEQIAKPLRERGFDVRVDPNLAANPALEQKLLEAGQAQPVRTAGENGAVMGATLPAQSDLQRLDVVQKKIASAQKNGGLGADEARALMQERSDLIDRIQNPTPAQATTVTQPTLAQDIPAGTASTIDSGVPRAAQRTEALAIENGLADSGFDLQPTAKMNMTDQADKAVNLINADYEAAKRVALGELDSPGDLRASVVYEAVKQRAVKDQDSALLYRLAKESSVPTAGKEAGQFIKGFDYRNPTDPTVAMKEIIDARAKSKVKGIPKDLTPDEADTITKMAQDVADKKAAIAEGGDPYDYGLAVVGMRRYKNELIDATKSLKDKVAPRGILTATFGTLKSLKASLDNSFFGRQGYKVLTTHPTVWAKAFKDSFGDIAKGLKGQDVLDALDAEILSRPNAINGIYKKMGLDVHSVEEAFPSSLPEKIPGLGRLFKASEYAYTGGAHRMRADLADQLLEKAQRAGVDINDKRQLDSLGKLINSMTGRGHLGKLEGAADTLNNLFFSARNWKSNIDTITAHQLQKNVTPFVRQEAAKNLLKMIAATSAVMTAANAWKPGSVQWDPRSSDFGKIKIGNTRFEITGGMASIATVASRIATQESKSTTSDRVTKLNSGEFGARSTWDVLMDYAEGKMSPGAQVIKQVMTGKDFVGNKVTPASLAKDALMPLPISNYQELKNDPKSANILLSLIADGLGIGTNTYSANKDWNQVNTKRIQGFKQTVDAKTFATANNDFNEEYNRWFDDVRRNPKYKNISDDTKKTLINQKKQDLTDEILGRYGYKYKRESKQDGEKKTIKDLMSL